MQTSYVHQSATFIGIKIAGGAQYFVRARWATDAGLLAIPPVGAPAPATYIETPPVFASSPTADNPVLVAPDDGWWQARVPAVRTVYAVVEWHPVNDAAWQHFDDYQFIVNHDPSASAGPDQAITLDAAGQIPADVRLDATTSDDVDLHAAVNPDPGPLHYRWWPELLPAAIHPNGAAWNGAYGVTTLDQASPLLFAANTAIPASDRGEYRLRLYVEDNDRASIGVKQGQVGVGAGSVSVLVTTAGSGVQILAPLASSPSFRSFESDRLLEVRIFYHVNDDVIGNPAYDEGWMVRCRIRQENEASDFALLSAPSGTVVSEMRQTRMESDGVFSWNGKMDASTLMPGATAVGSFTVELDLLDADGNPTAVGGSTARETNAIVIDLLDYLLPVELAFDHAAMNGAFMESGHAGKFGTRLHTGMDMVPAGVAIPHVRATRSGFYNLDGGATNDIRIDHEPPNLTHYLHGTGLVAFNNGDLVLQGDRLATMSNAGAAGVHLHFEHFQDLTAAGGQLLIRNPLEIVPLEDTRVPVIEEVFLRAAPAAGGAADLTLASTNLAGAVDLIVHCRDRANHLFSSGVENGPHGMSVVDDSGLGGPWPSLKFDAMTAVDQCADFFERHGISPNPIDVAHQYFPYLRRDSTVYNRQVSPLNLHVSVSDYFGHQSAMHDVTVGATVAVTAIPNPATSSHNPGRFNMNLDVINHGAGLKGIASDTFAISLRNAPAGWTIFAGATTGALNNGATRHVTVTIDPHGTAPPPGMVNFSLIVASGILTQVAAVAPITIVLN